MKIELGEAKIEVKAGTTSFRRGKETVEQITLFMQFANLPDLSYLSLTRKEAKSLHKQLGKLLIVKYQRG